MEKKKPKEMDQHVYKPGSREQIGGVMPWVELCPLNSYTEVLVPSTQNVGTDLETGSLRVINGLFIRPAVLIKRGHWAQTQERITV